MLKNASASWLRFPSGIVYGKVDFNASAALDVDEACDADELEVEDTTDDDVVDDVVDGWTALVGVGVGVEDVVVDEAAATSPKYHAPVRTPADSEEK